MATHAELLAAIRERNEGKVTEILKAQPALASERPANGPSAMLFATYMGALPVISAVRGAVKSLDACEAAALGDIARLTALLDADASRANARSGDGWPALHLAGFFGHRVAVDLLLARGADITAISGTADRNQALQAAISGACDVAIARTLLGCGADARHAGANGVTALHSAAARGNAEMVRLLVEAGASVSARLTDGRTPADLARERQHPEVAALLGQMGG